MKVTNGLDLQSQKITALADGTNPSDAINRGQLDAAVAGYKWKEPVRAATTANITLSGAQTIDGVSLVANDRALVKNQSTSAQNGIYIVSAGAWARALDYDANSELLGATVFVSEGAVHGNQQWLMTTDAPLVIGTTALTWVQFGGGTSYSAGAGISLSGGVISADTAVLARKASGTIGDGVATTLTFNHALNTQDVTVITRIAATNEAVIADWVANGVNTVQLTFPTPPSVGQYRVTVVA